MKGSKNLTTWGLDPGPFRLAPPLFILYGIWRTVKQILVLYHGVSRWYMPRRC